MARAIQAMRQQPLIIGAGPAGCAAAIRLCEAGLRPLLLERSAGPTDKVCGDFLSADTIGLARRLGLQLPALQAVPIRQVRLTHRGRSGAVGLPFAAMSLSRRRFDAALLDRAVSAGADLRAGVAVRSLTRDGEVWSVEAGHHRHEAASVFLATGKHELRGWPRAGRNAGAIGLKMYYQPAVDDAARIRGTIELILFPGGYAGLQPVEHGGAALCLAVRPTAFKAAGGWDGLLAALADGNGELARFLAGAQALLPRPLAVAGVPYGFRATATEPGLFRLGDQAVVIPSLTGDGMALALWSGISAAEAWLSGATAPAWQGRESQRTGGQMRLAGLVHRAALHAGVQAGLVLAANRVPRLVQGLARRTRLSADTVAAATA